MTQMCKTEGNSGQTKAGRGGGEGGVLDDHDGDRQEQRRESVMGDFPEKDANFLTYYTVCLYVDQQQLRWRSWSDYDCGVGAQQPVVGECVAT